MRTSRASIKNCFRSVATISLSAAITVSAADLPIREVVLYKHGVGFFERKGSIPSGEEARLDFREGEMNDVLKSLTVTDSSGGKVSGILYDSNESPDEKLSRYPFAVGDQEPLSAFLDRMKGSHFSLQTDKALAGTVIGARAIAYGPEADRHLVREQLTLLLDSGDIVNLDLSTIATFRFSDVKLQEQLKRYLATVSESRSKDKRSIYIDSTSAGARELDVTYISPAAIWKSSYRLTLADPASTLEGWAIVDNTTDDDWNNVKLSVVSGRPISFISQLDTPRYGNRQVAELPEDAAAGPVVYSGAVSEGSGNGLGQGNAGGVIGGVIGDANGAMPMAAPPPPPGAGLTMNEQMGFQVKSKPRAVMPRQAGTSTVVAGATGATVGELFEYNFATAITIKKNQSAMLPFLAEKLYARKLLIFQEGRGVHPVNAAELTNTSGKTLDGGPITVYDAGAYAGEALFETLRDNDKRLIGYAVDYGTTISDNFESGDRVVGEVHASNGLIESKISSLDTRTFKIKNVDAKTKTLLIERPIRTDYTPISPKPLEVTADVNRYEVKVPANGEATLVIKQEKMLFETTEIAGSSPDVLKAFLVNKRLTEQGRAQLQQVIDTKSRIVATDAELAGIVRQVRELDNDQNRWRQNINSLRGIPGQEEAVRRYSMQIADSDAQLGKFREQQKQAEQRKAELEQGLRDQLAKLKF